MKADFFRGFCWVEAWVHPKKIRHIFTIKGFTMPIAAFALFGWCMVIGGGLGNLGLARSTRPSATPLGWAIMSGINSIFGSLSPMLVNQPDLARYCKKPRDAGALQGLSVFFSRHPRHVPRHGVDDFDPRAYWNVWDMFNAILDHYWSAGSRTAIFLIGLAFFFGIFHDEFWGEFDSFWSGYDGACAEMVDDSSRTDFPWELMANASAFLSFLGSYNIFMAPLCAVIIVDYFIVRKGNVHVPSCYDGKPSGLYWYWCGVHLSGVAAWVIGTSMGIPGLVGQYRPQIISDAAKYMYMMGWLLTFTTSATIYYAITFFVEPQLVPTGRESTPFTREWLSNEGREGFYEGEMDDRAIFAPPTPPATDREEYQIGEKGHKSRL
ncbi:Uridine permease [Cercospora zeina]